MNNQQDSAILSATEYMHAKYELYSMVEAGMISAQDYQVQHMLLDQLTY